MKFYVKKKKKIIEKCAKGTNPSAQGVYKGQPNQNEKRKKKLQ